MSYFDISGAVFNNQLRELETSDPAHADVFNAVFRQLQYSSNITARWPSHSG